MNLPYILDVAIGLIFIYLILSLLASEIQELIATLLQWRAAHLKKSIEILLASGNNHEESRAINLANNIYDNPLIKNLNQEAKGGMSTLPRKFTWMLGSIYRSMQTRRPGADKNETVFGERKRSGPSYIPAETFASTLLETLQIPTLIHELSQYRLEKFKDERLIKEIEDLLDTIEKSSIEDKSLLLNDTKRGLEKLKIAFNKIVEDFRNNKATLVTTIERMHEKLDLYISICQSHFPEHQQFNRGFIKPLQSLKQENFGSSSESSQTEKAVLLGELKPSLTEIVEVLQINSPAHRELAAIIKDKDSLTYKAIEEAIHTVPESLRESLVILAKRAESKVESTEEDINKLRQEVEVWFDRSMDRASGVYKRNAKGVALIIGFFLAVVANADTLHIVSRLSRDSAIRTTITQNAGEIVTYTGNSSIKDLIDLRNATNDALSEIALPLGWTPANLEQQTGWAAEEQNPFPYIKLIRMIPGWILSGIAIAMGAPFWFDLLSKVVNVRNVGKPPTSNVASKNES
jgi:hypothetical protein